MTKNKLLIVLSNILWLLIILLPIICYALNFINDTEKLSFNDFFNNFGFQHENNVIYNFIVSLFGYTGYFPIFSNGICGYFTWLICVELIRLIINFVLLVPKLLNKYLNKLSSGD